MEGRRVERGGWRGSEGWGGIEGWVRFENL